MIGSHAKLSYIIAKNTFIEVIRDRVLYILLLFAFLFMGLSFAIGQLSYDEIFRLSLGLGLSSIHLCFMGLTIFLGSSLFYREIERKTIFTLLVRPISRWHYMVGKYLGLMSVLFILLLGFILSFSVIQLSLGLPLYLSTYVSFFGVLLESGLLLSATFFFSSFCRPFLAIACSVSFFLVGHWVDSLGNLIQKSDSLLFKAMGTAVMYAFPDLSALNWRDYAIAKAFVNSNDLYFGFCLTLAWAFLFFTLSQAIFRRKDFE